MAGTLAYKLAAPAWFTTMIERACHCLQKVSQDEPQ